MLPLSAPKLLAVWEHGLEKPPLERALALLEAAFPDSSRETLASLSIGRRDSTLLRLREWAFGPGMVALSLCRSCGQQLEITLDAPALRQDSGDAKLTEVSLALAGYEVRLRLPNTADLLSCAGLDVTKTQERLFARCLLAAHSQDGALSAEQVPEEVALAAIEHTVEADPVADLEIELSCPSCCHRWHEVFDIVSFFWSEIDAWARRILQEVHVLAAAYGWTEAEVLALSPLRRQFYLEMAGS